MIANEMFELSWKLETLEYLMLGAEENSSWVTENCLKRWFELGNQGSWKELAIYGELL